MITIKTKEAASVWIGLLATAIAVVIAKYFSDSGSAKLN